MKIRMLKTVPGSLDGIRVTTYEDGKEYDLTGTAGARDLAQAFVGARMAVEAEPQPVAETAPVVTMTATQSDARDVSELHPYAEEKSIEAAPENKALAAPATKRPYNRKG